MEIIDLEKENNKTGNMPNKTESQGLDKPKMKCWIIPKITEKELNQTYITTLGDLIGLLEYGSTHNSVLLPNKRFNLCKNDKNFKQFFFDGYFDGELNKILTAVDNANCKTPYQAVKITIECIKDILSESKSFFIGF